MKPNAKRGAAVTRECRCVRVKHQHGDRAMYDRDGCRCTECRATSAAYARELRRRRAYAAWTGVPVDDLVNPVGSQRRVQALMRLGFSRQEIATQCGWASDRTVGDLFYHPLIHRDRAAAIRRAYDALWDKQPASRYAVRNRRYAERQGWPPPLAWDDDEIDDPAARPHIKPRTVGDTAKRVEVAERRAEVAELHRVGVDREVIAHLVGITRRTVERDLAALRKAAAA